MSTAVARVRSCRLGGGQIARGTCVWDWSQGAAGGKAEKGETSATVWSDTSEAAWRHPS